MSDREFDDRVGDERRRPSGRTLPAGAVLVVGETDRATRTAADLREAFGANAVERVDVLGEADVATRDVSCVVADHGTAAGARAVGSVGRSERAPPVLALVTDDPAAAIDAGATDVVADGDGRAALVARVEHAVACHRRTDAARSAETTLERTDAVVLRTDFQGTIEWASAAIDSRLGYPPTAVTGADLVGLLHPADREAVRSAMEAVVEASHPRHERLRCRLRRETGSWRTARLALATTPPDRDPEGLVLTVTFPESADAPAESGLERFGHPVFALDDDWAVTGANAAAVDLLDLPESDPLGTVIWRHLPEAAVGRCYERFVEAIATDAVVGFDVEWPDRGPFELLVHPDGGSAGEGNASADESAGGVGESAGGVTVYARPIPHAERVGDRPDGDEQGDGGGREREDALETRRPPSRDQLARVLDAIDDAVVLVDGDEVILANAATYDLTGAGTAVGRSLSDVFDPDLAERIDARAADPIRRAEPIEWEFEPEPPASARPGNRHEERRTVAISVVPLGGDRAVVRGSDVTAASARRERVHAVARALEGLETAETELEALQGLADANLACLSARATAVYELTAGDDGEDEGRDDEDGRGHRGGREDEDDGGGRRRVIGSGSASPALETVDALVGDGESGERNPIASAVDPGKPVFLDPSPGRGGPIAEAETPDGTDDSTGEKSGQRRVLAVPVADEFALVAVTGPNEFTSLDRATAAALGSGATLALARIRRAAAVEALVRERDRHADRATTADALLDHRIRLGRTIRAADDPGDLNRSACAALTAMEAVAFAWIGGPTGGDATAGLVPEAAASDGEGDTPADTDRAARLATGGAREGEPGAVAVESGERASVDAAAVEGPGPAWRRAILEHGYQSVLAVPLDPEGHRLGALVVYGRHANAFDERVATVLEDVGRSVAYARSALEAKRSLLGDGADELTLAVAGPDPLVAVARRVDAPVELDATLPRGDGAVTLFATAADGDGDAVVAALDSLDAVRAVQVVDVGPGPTRFEATVDRPTLADAVVDHGGVVRTATADGEVTVDLPPCADVRAVVRSLDELDAEVDLRSRRHRDRPVGRRGTLACRAALRERVTDRQFEVLRGAHHAGYFEWPRERTGEEVADALDISQPTFTRHFRAAERAVFSLLFEER